MNLFEQIQTDDLLSRLEDNGNLTQVEMWEAMAKAASVIRVLLTEKEDIIAWLRSPMSCDTYTIEDNIADAIASGKYKKPTPPS